MIRFLTLLLLLLFSTQANADLYFILDTTHGDYASYIQEVDDAATDAFTPRVSIDGTLALIQIKEGTRGYLTKQISWLESYSACVVSTGNMSWASTQISSGWTPEAGNNWFPPLE